MIGVRGIFDSASTPRSLWVILGCALTLTTGALTLTVETSTARAQGLQTAELLPGAKLLHEAPLPRVLSQTDLVRYQRIFALQQQHNWRGADREIVQLKNKLLLGTVLAQRYLGPDYRAHYRELVQWLKRYRDQPAAKEIYALALARHPKGAPPPPKPPAPAVLAQTTAEDLGFEPQPTGTQAANRKRLVPAEARRAAALEREISELASSAPRKAQVLLEGREAKDFIGAATREALRAAIAQGYLAEGNAQEALLLSTTTKTSAYAPIANWNAGLADWRLKRWNEACRHFEALARSPNQSPWVKSAAAFWTARTELRSDRPQDYAFWLRVAAEEPRTFYGLLAGHLLGIDRTLEFNTDPFTEFDAQLIVGTAAGRRLVALLALGEHELAAKEFHHLAAHASPALLQSLASLANRANLPAVSLQLAGMLSDGRSQDFALYPVPRWQPLGGFTVDRALIFALMRQESQFVPRAQSRVGATGLMQLMPATARSMASRAGVPLEASDRRAERAALSDPGYNLLLAQEYIQVLLNDDRINNNLILFAAAYNRGPSAVLRWARSRPEYRKDPLLFIESMPWPQTRIFTLRVLTNYWIYRLRLGEATPGLDELAAGHWPLYTPPDTTTIADAAGGRHAQN